MPGWGACHIGEHADRSPWIAYPFNALQMRRTFHHAANAPQLNLRNDSALTHNRFFCIDNTCRFWALHLSCTTLPDHPQLARSAVHINTAAHIFAQRFKPHLGPNRTGSQATLITSRPPPSPAYKHRSYRIAIALDRQWHIMAHHTSSVPGASASNVPWQDTESSMPGRDSKFQRIVRFPKMGESLKFFRFITSRYHHSDDFLIGNIRRNGQHPIRCRKVNVPLFTRYNFV